MSYIFVPMLVDSKMHGSERASPNLLFNDVLIDTVHSSSIVLAVGVL